MHVTRVIFTFHDSRAEGAVPSTDSVQALLGAWRMNGQLCGREWPIIQSSSEYSTIAFSPESDSLEPRFNGKYVTSAIAQVEAEGLKIAWQDLGEDAKSSQTCSCSTPNAYLLFTTYVSLEPPIRCLDCFRPVALYRMKVMASGEFNEVISWQSDYQCCDRLQMNCRVLEDAATQELANVDSDLTKEGRAHCKTLAASSGRPFFYYLHRAPGESYQSEVERLEQPPRRPDRSYI